VYLGADDSRQTNDLNWDTFGLKFTGEYTTGDHTISFGLERDDLEVFNLFVQETQGEFEFEALCSSSNPDGCIDAFESGDPDDITYESGANSNNPLDAGVTWGYEINSAYIQDEIQLMDGDFTLIAGVRHDWYTSSDLPIENQNFIDRNGFTNATNFDGESLTQPRLGFNWEVNADLTLRGGVGMYSGGNPNVWLSNNYSNNGILTAESDDSDIQGILGGLDHDGIGGNTLFTVPHTSGDGPGGNLPLWNIPQDMFDDVAGATGNFAVNGIDPNFKIPSAWKYALGATYRFGDEWTVSVDFQHSKGEDDAIVLDGTLEEIGNAPDGRPLYQNVDRSDHGLFWLLRS
jgi:predicted porin